MEGIRDSLIMKEVNAIIDGGAKNVHFTFSAEMYVNDEKIPIHRVNYINIAGAYSDAYQDEVIASFKLEPSVYQKKILPNHNNIMVHLIKTPVFEDGTPVVGPTIVLEKLRAYLVHPSDLVANQQVEMTADGLDLMGFKDIAFQLADPFANKIRLFQFSTVYRSMTPGDCLKAAIATAFAGTKIEGQIVAPQISMVRADNQNRRTAIPLPLRPLIDMPHYFQDKQGGIYNAGIRMYCKARKFFVFPKYYLGDRPEQRRVLTIFNLPANQFPGAERTYRETDYQVMVIATGKNAQLDMTQHIELNEGNGVRFTDANAILNGGQVVSEGNKAFMRRGFANSEFIDGETGRDENYAPVSRSRVTANPYAEVSRLASRKGVVSTFVWENADPYLLDPGMDVKVISLDNGQLTQRLGSLSNAEFHMGPRVNNVKNNQLNITGGLSVFLNKTVEVIG